MLGWVGLGCIRYYHWSRNTLDSQEKKSLLLQTSTIECSLDALSLYEGFEPYFTIIITSLLFVFTPSLSYPFIVRVPLLFLQSSFPSKALHLQRFLLAQGYLLQQMIHLQSKVDPVPTLQMLERVVVLRCVIHNVSGLAWMVGEVLANVEACSIQSAIP